MFKFGIIGLGNISQYYLSAIVKHPDIKLVAVCDKNANIDAPIKTNIPFYTDYKKMFKKHELDAVIILTPNFTHNDLAKFAINNKIHVLCEKPLGISLEECRRVVNHANAKKIILFTAFHRRYNKHIVRLKRQVKSKKNLRSIHVRYLENIQEHSGGEQWYNNPKECGGGCVIDNGINVFDLLLDFVHKPIMSKFKLTYGKGNLDIKGKIKLVDDDTKTNIVIDLDWKSDNEIKDIVIKTKTATLKANMLADFPMFKGSLWHEYEGVLHDFINLLKNKQFNFSDHRSLTSMRLVDEIYNPRCSATFPQITRIY